MAHTLALVWNGSHATIGALQRLRRALPALLVTAITLLDAHGVAAANEAEARARQAMLAAHLQALPETELRRGYLHCAHVSNERLLGPDEAVLCVLLADTLMHRAFDGDFAALIAWYQRNREPAGARPPR